jgi:import inner membrane translocase subunit TIM21
MDFGQKSQLLSESLDGQQKRTSGPKHDTVGPFQLGLSQQALRKEKPLKKWSELSTGGKGVYVPCET